MNTSHVSLLSFLASGTRYAGGGSITQRMAAGTQDHPLKGGRVTSSLQAELQVRLPKFHGKTGTVL